MPQLDTTYFVSQIFWLVVLFSLFYLAVSFFIVPKLQSIISARSHIKDESESFIGIADLEMTQLKIEAKKKSEATNVLIKKLEAAAASKYDSYSKELLSKLQKKLDNALEESSKEIAELTARTIAEEKMNELAIESAKHIIFKLTSLDVTATELKKFIK